MCCKCLIYAETFWAMCIKVLGDPLVPEKESFWHANVIVEIVLHVWAYGVERKLAWARNRG
jgi:hypothetical protein